VVFGRGGGGVWGRGRGGVGARQWRGVGAAVEGFGRGAARRNALTPPRVIRVGPSPGGLKEKPLKSGEEKHLNWVDKHLKCK